MEAENKNELAAEHIYVDRHPNDTEIGTFQIKSSNENFLLRIGGFAKLAGYYDAGLENELFFKKRALKKGYFSVHCLMKVVTFLVQI